MAQQPLPVGRHEPADARRRLNVILPRPKRNPARASRPAEHTSNPARHGLGRDQRRAARPGPAHFAHRPKPGPRHRPVCRGSSGFLPGPGVADRRRQRRDPRRHRRNRADSATSTPHLRTAPPRPPAKDDRWAWLNPVNTLHRKGRQQRTWWWVAPALAGALLISVTGCAPTQADHLPQHSGALPSATWSPITEAEPPDLERFAVSHANTATTGT